MHVRCPACRATTWLELEAEGELCDLTCSGCRGPLAVDRERCEPARLTALRNVAVDFAYTYGVDQFSANSVVLGVMTLPRAVEMQRETPAAPPGLAEITSPLPIFGRPRRSSATSDTALPLPPATTVPAGAVLLVGGLAFITIAWATAQSWSDQQSTARRQQHVSSRAASLALPPPAAAEPAPGRHGPAAAEITRDAGGEILQVVASGPRAVLDQVCASWTPSPCEAVEVALGGPDGSAHYGLMRPADGPEDLLAFPIYRQPMGRRWMAGDGRRPLTVVDAARLRLGSDS